ncbi:MAG: ATP-binding cassette domain-containing protein, partial [Rhodospirillales bacterium]|nr:ATP-binding cassette domain-containing protein [Rhodospirillales bacterium]
MLEVSVNNTFGTFQLNVDFMADSGLTALFGRSGSGKTKLVNALAGLEEITKGRIVINDKVLLDTNLGINLPPEKRRVGYVFQDARLFPHLDVERNLIYGMKLRKTKEQRHSLAEIVELLSLEQLLTRHPATLSGGEKQRVAIGRALLSSPEFLLMDEPLASLDSTHKEEIL